MKKTGWVLFLALATVFFMTAGNAAAQSQINYSETVAQGVFCEVIEGEIFCDVDFVTDQAQLLGTLVLTKEIVDDILADPLSATIEIDIFNESLGIGLFAPIDLSPILIDGNCFNGTRTCVGKVYEFVDFNEEGDRVFDSFLGTINMRATARTIRFTYKTAADLLLQLEEVPGTINITLDAEALVQSPSSLLPTVQCFNNMPVRGLIRLRNVTGRDGLSYELLFAHFRAQGRQGVCPPLVAE